MVSGRYSDWRDTQDIVPIERPDTPRPETQVAGGSRAE